ncbi:MAG: hypothetical protein P8H19_05195 [Polaribacter sp.]|nr:hypothetical protein [Polaribacter sp.]
MIKKRIYLFSLSILFTTAIQSQDISNKWAINIGSGLVIYPGKYDRNMGLGFKYSEQFPRISISRYMFKNITFSGALSISPIQRKKYTTFDGEIRYDFGTSENIISIYALIGGSIIENKKMVLPTLNFGAGGTLWISDSWGLNSQLMYKYIPEVAKNYQKPHIYAGGGIVYRFSSQTASQKNPTLNRKRLWD